ncbi:MAG: phosphoglycerate kinase [Patescibacteria group bacterium]
MKINTLDRAKKLSGKRVLVRADFNVPIKNGKIQETYKIEQGLPTINFLVQAGAKVIIMSHLGRPNGPDKTLSLKPVAKSLEKLFGKKINFFSVGDKEINGKKLLDKFVDKIKSLPNGSVTLLENIRFIKGEEKNDSKVAKALASLGEIFVLDGFAVAHRDSASVSGVAKYLPSYAGLLMEKELSGLSRLTDKPKRPFAAVIGGAKMETKIPLIKKLLPKVDCILLGGGIVNTCLWAKGYKVGGSLIEKKYKKEALAYLKNRKIIMPVDVVIGDARGKKVYTAKIDNKFKISDKNLAIYDIGPETITRYAKILKNAETLAWNGALGMFEQSPYHWGSYSIARIFAARAKGKEFGVAGGGETVEIVKKLKLTEEIDLVSTGGGAMLEFLSGKILPGAKAVAKK